MLNDQEIQMVNSADPQAFRVTTPHLLVAGNLARGEIRQSARLKDGSWVELVHHTGNFVQFRFNGKSYCLDVEDHIKDFKVVQGEGQVVLTHQSTLRVDWAWRKQIMVAEIRYDYCVRQDDPSIQIKISLSVGAGVKLTDIKITSGIDNLNCGLDFGAIKVSQAGNEYLFSGLGDNKRTFHTGRAQSMRICQENPPPDFAHALHLSITDGAMLADITAEGQTHGRLHWVYLRYDAGNLRDGESFSVEEKRLVTCEPGHLSSNKTSNAIDSIDANPLLSERIMKNSRIGDLIPGLVELPPPVPKEPALSGVYMGSESVLTRIYTQQLMFVSTNDLIVGPYLINLGINEPHNTRMLTSLTQPGDVFVDVGANIGYFSVLGGWRSYPGGTVWAFEPQPAMYKLLADNLAMNGFGGSSHARRIALSDCAGTVPMRTFPGYLATSSMRSMSEAFIAHTAAMTGRDSVVIDIETLRLDDVMHDVPEINVMKIDVEGHEPEVVRGAQKIIARSRNIKIVMEFVPGLMARDVTLAHLALLRQLGLSIFRIETDGNLSFQPDDEVLMAFHFSDLLLLRL